MGESKRCKECNKPIDSGELCSECRDPLFFGADASMQFKLKNMCRSTAEATSKVNDMIKKDVLG